MFVVLCVILRRIVWCFLFFFFNDTATTEIYTLSLHDALPISGTSPIACCRCPIRCSTPSTASRTRRCRGSWPPERRDRKSTRLNSSHANISYAVFCLKKKKNKNIREHDITKIDEVHSKRHDHV